MANRYYIAIDLKSFYASVECVERRLDPLNTNLVVADESRTEKTICLAVSPSLKALGIGGRPRLFEAIAKVNEINSIRRNAINGKGFSGKSFDARLLERNPSLEVDFIKAPPRMGLYMEYSTKAYAIYLRYVAPEDIHVYSVDEAFLDVTDYLATYGRTPEELAMDMIKDVLAEIGITATAGIGTNLYLSKVAMDIVAKHVEPDENGVRIASLDEMSYRKRLWTHVPLSDFWRVGRKTEKKLNKNGIFTMGDIARCSLGKLDDFYNEELLYSLFGINAELLIDHAWGYEPVRISDIKAYRPKDNSLSRGQVLKEPYSFEKARLCVKEMADLLSLDLVKKGLLASQMTLTIGYDIANLSDPHIMEAYHGDIERDFYGRLSPKRAHGSINFEKLTASSKAFLDAAECLFDRICNPDLLVRRMYIGANHVKLASDVEKEKSSYDQLSFFDMQELKPSEGGRKTESQKEIEAKESRMQQAIIAIQKRYGKNAILRGMNYVEGGTTIERNGRIGGHRA